MMSAVSHISTATKFLFFFVLLFVAIPSTAAVTLIRPGFRAVLENADGSELTFGGNFVNNFVSGSCSTNTYVESTCDDLPGTLVADETTRAVINGDTLTVCDRHRHTSVCTSCNAFGIETSCTETTSDSCAGSFKTYNLVSSPGNIASLWQAVITDFSDPNLTYCSSVCTDQATGDLVFPNDDRDSCTFAGGWIAVNSDYADECAAKQICEELEIIQGCEDTYTGSITGIYRPVDTVDGCTSDVDTTRTVYQGDRGFIMYHASQNDWRLNSLGCSLLPPIRAEWEANDEPYLNPASETECYDGGYGSNREYEWTPFLIRCNKRRGEALSIGNSGVDNSGAGIRDNKINDLSINIGGTGNSGDSSGSIMDDSDSNSNDGSDGTIDSSDSATHSKMHVYVIVTFVLSTIMFAIGHTITFLPL